MSKQNEIDQDFDDTSFSLMLNDLENEASKVYEESIRSNSKLNYNNITSKSISNFNDANNNETDNTAFNSNKNAFRFYDIICKKCLEQHLDRCDLCSYKNESLKSKLSLSKSYKSILIHPSTPKSSKSKSSNKKSKVKLDISGHPEINYAVKSISNIGNFPSLTTNTDDISKSIYAVVFKEKSGSDLKENLIEDLIYSDYIDVSNLSTPFEKDFINHETTENFKLGNKQDFLAKRKKTSMLLDMNQRAKLSKIRVSKHYFRNLTDLQHKYRHENEKITFKTIPPYAKSSNSLFNDIDKFDINDSYKVKKPMMDQVSQLIERNNSLIETIRKNEKAGQIKSAFHGFISTKKFDQELFKKERYKVRPDSPMSLLNNLILNTHLIKIN
jgi:hypothetical protein